MRGPEYVTAEEMHRALKAAIAGRPDVGFRGAAGDVFLQARNPFEPASRRRPKKEIVLIGSLILLGLAAFSYFNLALP
jgi:hypothetical protein